jgi:hypothetical protein
MTPNAQYIGHERRQDPPFVNSNPMPGSPPKFVGSNSTPEPSPAWRPAHLHGRTMQIGPLTFAIEVCPSLRREDGQSLLGAARTSKQRIYIDENCPPQLLLSTMLHEIYHEFCEFTGREQSEFEADAISYFFAQVLRDNPWLPQLAAPQHFPLTNATSEL